MSEKPSKAWLEAERRGWWYDAEFQSLSNDFGKHVGYKNARDFMLKRFGMLPPDMPRARRQNVLDVLRFALLTPREEVIDYLRTNEAQTKTV